MIWLAVIPLFDQQVGAIGVSREYDSVRNLPNWYAAQWCVNWWRYLRRYGAVLGPKIVLTGEDGSRILALLYVRVICRPISFCRV